MIRSNNSRTNVPKRYGTSAAGHFNKLQTVRYDQPAQIVGTPNPVEFARRTLHFYPDRTQERILLSKSKDLILNCCRQWGKSTMAAILAAHEMLYGRDQAMVVVIAPCKDQSNETVEKIRNFLIEAGKEVPGDGMHSNSIRLDNGSRCLALPGTDDSTRGYSAATMLIVDEAARVSDAIYGAVHPCLGTTNGRTILLSTPNGRQGFFYEAWTDGSDWDRISIPVEECPRISQEFIEKERRRMDDGYFRQEFQCEFHASDQQYFSPKEISGCLTDEWDGWIPQVFREKPGVLPGQR